MTETKTEIAQMGMNAIEMLGSILKAVEKQADEFSNIKSLAKTGAYIADDHHNLLDCIREEAQGPGNERS